MIRTPRFPLLLVLACSPLLAAPPVAVLPGESKPAAARLSDARKMADAGKLPEAVALLASLSDMGDKVLVPLADGRSVRLRDQAQRDLARLPPAGLAAYRRRAEPQARKWLEAGDLTRVADEASCTMAALTAFDKLGDKAFLDGRFDEAEQWWRRIAPLDQGGTSFPDPPPARAARGRAKQVLARLFAGRANTGIEAFRKLHPTATGKLAGQEGRYADLLAKLAGSKPRLTPRRGWQTFGGIPTRGRIATAGNKIPADLGRLCRAGPTWQFSLEDRKHRRAAFPPIRKGPHAARRLAFHPILIGTTALVSDGRFVTAYDLKTGTANDWFNLADHLVGTTPPASLPAPLDLRHTLSADASQVYARLGTATVRDIRPGKERTTDTESVLVCLSLAKDRDGRRLRWLARAADPARKEYAVFEGAPLVAGDRAWIAATRFEGDRVVTAIHCYATRSDEASPAPLWRVDVCETRELRPGGDDGAGKTRTRHHLLTRAGGRVVYCSHSGAVVAVDARTGQRVWAVRYSRRESLDTEDAPSLRDLAPCLMAEGLLYAAPSDSDRVLCLDPLTGETKWQRDGLDVVHLLGAGKGRLIFTTWRNPKQGRLEAGSLRAIDARDGSDASGWVLPDDEGGLLPYGRGLLAGDLVLWPTFRKPYGVFAIRQEDGRQADNPSLLHRIPSGNLVYADGILLVADQRTLHAFVPASRIPDVAPRR